MKSIVRVTTLKMRAPTAVTAFEFGTVAADSDSFGLLSETVQSGAESKEVFWLDRNREVPAGQEIRFDLRFALNVHNSVHLQLRLDPGKPVSLLTWRWAAPIGFLGVWSTAEQQAPWWDHGWDYCINISPAGDDIEVRLSESPGAESQMAAFIPDEAMVPELQRIPPSVGSQAAFLSCPPGRPRSQNTV